MWLGCLPLPLPLPPLWLPPNRPQSHEGPSQHLSIHPLAQWTSFGRFVTEWYASVDSITHSYMNIQVRPSCAHGELHHHQTVLVLVLVGEAFAWLCWLDRRRTADAGRPAGAADQGLCEHARRHPLNIHAAAAAATPATASAAAAAAAAAAGSSSPRFPRDLMRLVGPSDGPNLVPVEQAVLHERLDWVTNARRKYARTGHIETNCQSRAARVCLAVPRLEPLPSQPKR